ncbi:MAG: hypothetical protein ACLS7Z_03880 [Christensenellales bacterium]
MQSLQYDGVLSLSARWPFCFDDGQMNDALFFMAVGMLTSLSIF